VHVLSVDDASGPPVCYAAAACFHFLRSYPELFGQYALAWFDQLTPTQQQNLRVTKEAGHVRFTPKGLSRALRDWPTWVTQQQEQLEQGGNAASRGRGRARAQARLQQWQDTLASHSNWAECFNNAFAGRITHFAEVLVKPAGVGQSIRVTESSHRRAGEFSWVLLAADSTSESAPAGMTFMKVGMVLQHTDGRNVLHMLMYGDLHTSGSAGGGADVDPFIGMPVFSKQPDRAEAGGLPAGFKVCVPCQQAAYNITVLRHPDPSKDDMLVCLARQPDPVFQAAEMSCPCVGSRAAWQQCYGVFGSGITRRSQVLLPVQMFVVCWFWVAGYTFTTGCVCVWWVGFSVGSFLLPLLFAVGQSGGLWGTVLMLKLLWVGSRVPSIVCTGTWLWT
jgi:hypothetical protein